MEDSHRYLAESENLIRNHGLSKPVNSQKVSKLHHIFSFLRIIEESTIQKSLEVSDECEINEQTLTGLESSSSSLVASDDERQAVSSRLDWLEEDESDEDSLFLSIYQIPATLFSLLSQTSSLCKDLAAIDILTPDSIRRSQIIEDRIFEWKPPETLTLKNAIQSQEGTEANTSSYQKSSSVFAHIIAAMHDALIVHFQRQVHKTDPRVLQHYVMKAANHLVAHEKLKKSLNVRTTAFPWPCFIVGCEAYDFAARQKVQEYLDLVRDYNLGSLMEVEKVIYEVWRRQNLGRVDKCWDNVLRDWGLRIVLT